MPGGQGTNYETRRYEDSVSRPKYLCGLLNEAANCSSYVASVITSNKCEELVEWYWKHRGSRRKTCSNLTLFATNPTWIGLGFNFGLQGEKPATNHMIRGTRTKRNSIPPLTFQIWNLVPITTTVPGSIPGGVTGFFSDVFPSDRTMALGSTQLLVKISTRNIPGGKGGRCVRLTTLPPSCAECHEILGV